MCSFPASGSSWKSLAREGVAMDDPGCRQGVTLSERSELVPKEPTPAIPPRQPFLPNPRAGEEMGERRYLVVDGVDGRVHHVECGDGGIEWDFGRKLGLGL